MTVALYQLSDNARTVLMLLAEHQSLSLKALRYLTAPMLPKTALEELLRFGLVEVNPAGRSRRITPEGRACMVPPGAGHQIATARTFFKPGNYTGEELKHRSSRPGADQVQDLPSHGACGVRKAA